MSRKTVAKELLPPVVVRALRKRPPPSPAAPVIDSAPPQVPNLAWMKFINPGMLAPSNIDLMAFCLTRLPSDAPLIEIGSFTGLSLNHMIYFLRRDQRPNQVFSVDEWHFEGASLDRPIENTSILYDDYRDHVVETFRRNVQLFSGDRLPFHIQLSSDVFFEAWREEKTCNDFFGRTAKLGGPISFAYIDGDHSYEQSKRDFENVDRRLERGGFIIFDDSADDSGWGSHRTAKEAADSKRYELVAKNPNYCIRKKL
jgi:hypothetical protein